MQPALAVPGSPRRRLPSRTTLAALATGAVVFWAPALLLRSRLEPHETFRAAIALFGLLVPLALVAVWRAWFDAPTRTERLGHWLRLALFGPYLGAVLVGAVTFFAGPEFREYRDSPAAPSASGVLLPVALLTVRAATMLLHHSLFVAAAVLLVVTLFVPRGAHRPAL